MRAVQLLEHRGPSEGVTPDRGTVGTHSRQEGVSRSEARADGTQDSWQALVFAG